MTAEVPAAETMAQILEEEAIADLTQKLTLAGHTVHADKAGGYTVTRWGHCRRCMDADSLRAFAHQVLGTV